MGMMVHDALKCLPCTSPSSSPPQHKGVVVVVVVPSAWVWADVHMHVRGGTAASDLPLRRSCFRPVPLSLVSLVLVLVLSAWKGCCPGGALTCAWCCFVMLMMGGETQQSRDVDAGSSVGDSDPCW